MIACCRRRDFADSATERGPGLRCCVDFQPGDTRHSTDDVLLHTWRRPDVPWQAPTLLILGTVERRRARCAILAQCLTEDWTRKSRAHSNRQENAVDHPGQKRLSAWIASIQSVWEVLGIIAAGQTSDPLLEVMAMLCPV